MVTFHEFPEFSLELMRNKLRVCFIQKCFSLRSSQYSASDECVPLKKCIWFINGEETRNCLETKNPFQISNTLASNKNKSREKSLSFCYIFTKLGVFTFSFLSLPLVDKLVQTIATKEAEKVLFYLLSSYILQIGIQLSGYFSEKKKINIFF